MSTSERTFNQVKAILNKLDRAVDDARNKRTTPTPAPAPAPVAPAVSAPVAPMASTPSPNKPASQYGRAQPIRPATPPSANARWNITPRN